MLDHAKNPKNSDGNMDSYRQMERVLNAIAKLPEGYAEQIPQRCFERRYALHEYFITAGEEATGLGFVVKGLFRYFYIDMEGKERIKTFALKDDFVVSYDSLLSASPSKYFIQALEPSVVLILDKSTYMNGVENDPYWATIARKYVERLLIEKIRREESLLMLDAAARYERFIGEYPQLGTRLRLKDIASFLGMTDVTLSRLRHNRS